MLLLLFSYEEAAVTAGHSGRGRVRFPPVIEVNDDEEVLVINAARRPQWN